MAANGNGQGIGSLFTLIKRLEAATSRLEDIAVAQNGLASPSIPSEAFGLDGAAAPAPAAAPAAPAATATPSVKAFDELLDGPLAAFLKNAQTVGGPAATQAGFVDSAFKAQRSFLLLASSCHKPSSTESFMELLKPTSEPLNKTVEVKDSNRGDKKLFNGLNAVAEGIPGLAWVTAESKPGPMVGEAKDSAQFWVNRVLKDHKDSEPTLVEWAKSFIVLLEDLRKYIMQHHTTALTWNAKGEDPTSFASQTASAAAPAGGAPPPPPPPPPGPPAPPPPPPAGAAAAPSAGGGGGMGAVFADLNKGESVTSGLRKVDKSEMTHKNPALRGNAPVPSSGAAAGGSPTLGGKQVKPPKPSNFQKKPSKKALDGNKWAVEYFDGDSNVVINETEINQIVNIFGCKNSTIAIKGKVNAVTLVSCTKTSVLLDSTVSSLAITSSPSFTVQILGKVPTIMIDATDGGQIYLSKESLDVEIVTAKTSALNVSLPVEGEEEGIFAEKAVPEQLKTVVKDGKLITTVLEHTG